MFEELCQLLLIRLQLKPYLVKAGRITHGTVFIGSPYEMSYSEYLYSDEGIKESKRMLDGLINRARDLNAGRPAVTLDQVFQGGVHA
jgi:hypothetical protein